MATRRLGGGDRLSYDRIIGALNECRQARLAVERRESEARKLTGTRGGANRAIGRGEALRGVVANEYRHQSDRRSLRLAREIEE